MLHGSLPYTIVLLTSAAITGITAGYALRFRRARAAPAFIGLMICATFYALGYGLELASSEFSNMVLWNKVQYLGIPFIPVLWVLLAARYSGKDDWLRRPVISVFFIISLLTFLIRMTNGLHHFFYSGVSLDPGGPFPRMILQKGTWYWIHIGFSNLVLLIGTMILIRFWTQSRGPYRLQSAVMVAGSALPWLGFFIYIFGLSPYGLDTTPMVMAFAGPIIAWGLFRYRILDLVPVAKDSVFASMRGGAIVLDMQGRIADFNSAAKRILPDLTQKTIGLPLDTVIQSFPEIHNLLQQDSPSDLRIQVGEGDGRRYFQTRLSLVINRRQKRLGRVLSFSDITEQVLLTERLQSLATIDDLTGTYNRRHFFELGRAELGRASRYGRALSLIILDLDHFKQVNDTWGHEAGDLVLHSACQALQDALRAVDILGRHGGEEFAILLPETPPDQACGVAERLRATIAGKPVKISEEAAVSFTASIGVTGLGKVGTETIDLFIRKADAAMYKAKEAGRNCIRFVDIHS